MNKLNISFEKFGNYIREVSIVVIGVAITLSVSVWINNRNEKKDVDLQLNTVKIELKENVKILDEMIEDMKPEYRYMIYLETHDKKSLNEDTLRSYIPVCYSNTNYTFKTNAFEMFKNSGTMRLMNDSELLMEIWSVYADLNGLKQMYDEFLRRKWNHIEKDLSLQGIDREKKKMKLNVVPLYDFYRLGFSSLSDTERIQKEVKETISKLEETKDDTK
jgi:hypothetical protein